MKIESKIKAVKPMPKSYGHIGISSKDVPEVKNAKLTDEHQFLITVSVRALRAPDKWEISEGYKKPGEITLDGDITKIEPVKKSVK